MHVFLQQTLIRKSKQGIFQIITCTVTIIILLWQDLVLLVHYTISKAYDACVELFRFLGDARCVDCMFLHVTIKCSQNRIVM